MKKIVFITLVLVAALDATARPSHAYLDPGAGSQLLQMTLAGALGLVFALKTMFQRVLQSARARRSK
ncbi:hypothetical protein [Armatimonas rosea]|uniref:Uncharacterized protein n=1 Tax=Armatimonas rosea TaxID=685828 RepID=A0A7W9W5P6_ARMRO|nr:hypothetical protein [Armatimonas rosea]MBB6048797.1 hypothetical protein [Armatimonas rosea]